MEQYQSLGSLSRYFHELGDGHEAAGHVLDKVILSQNILPSCIAKALRNRIMIYI
jgi:hypothetical protein